MHRFVQISATVNLSTQTRTKKTDMLVSHDISPAERMQHTYAHTCEIVARRCIRRDLRRCEVMIVLHIEM